MRLFRIYSKSKMRKGHSSREAFYLSGSIPAAGGTIPVQQVADFSETPHFPWSGVLWILIWVLTVAIALAGSHLYYRYKKAGGKEKKKKRIILNYKKKNL